jgi:undecaprenyl-diphosphatase
MHDILLSIILGVVEGITEFLPISSTAHLLVTERLLGLGEDWEAFTVVIQLGAILAVVALYFRRLWNILVMAPTVPRARGFIYSILVAFLPAAGLALKKLLTRCCSIPPWPCPSSRAAGSWASSSSSV